MSTKEEREIRKLDVEIAKIEAETAVEKQKLQSERDQLELQQSQHELQVHHHKLQEKIAQRGRITTISTFLIALATISTGLWGLFRSGSEFFSQRSQAYEFQVNRDMIELVNKLSSDSVLVRESAALLLSGYEENAIPVLLWSLRQGRTPDAVIASLRLIGKKKKVEPSDVLESLKASTHETLAHIEDAPTEQQNIKPLMNHLTALVTMTDADPGGVADFLDSLAEDIEQNSFLSEPNRIVLSGRLHLLLNTVRQRAEQL